MQLTLVKHDTAQQSLLVNTHRPGFELVDFPRAATAYVMFLGLKATQVLAVLIGLVLVSGRPIGQATPGSASIQPTDAALQSWEYTFTIDSYSGPERTFYANPAVTADHKLLHLEARYNDENLRTASLWVGYNFGRGDVGAGDEWEFKITPMLGGVFGRSNGIAPGCEVSVSYRKKVEASISNQYVFMRTKLETFYYAWPQLTYSPVAWFHVGAVAPHIAAYHTLLSIQRGFLVGVSHDRWKLTTYVFDPGSTGMIAVLEWGVSF
jgi:hypothetical protein